MGLAGAERPYKVEVSGYQSRDGKRTPVSYRRAFKHFVTAQNAAFDSVCSGPTGSSATVTFEPKDGRWQRMLKLTIDDACRVVRADLEWRRNIAIKTNRAAYGRREGLMVKQDRLTLTPTILADAKRFVGEVHRHHGPPVGHRFSVGVKDEAGDVRGVMCMGRAVSRKTDQYAVLEVTRVATDGCPNACSFLYGAACRIHRVHGFAYAQTFTLESEPGTSLRAAGWKPVAYTPGKSWSVPTRARSDKHTLERRVRWECRCGPSEAIELEAA